MLLHAPPHGAPARSAILPPLAFLVLAFAPAAPAVAQGTAPRLPSTIHPETSSAAEALLKTAASHVREAQWDSAVELYQRAIQQFPEALTLAEPPDPEQGRVPGVEVFVNVSDYAQRRIALLPPEALRLYRNRVDGEARRLFEQGRDRLDPEPLRRVVEAYFCSSWGDDAAELLADLAFQEGRFDEALELYRRLLPASDPTRAATTYPDPDVDVARVAAKAILCDEAMGRRRGGGDLEDFARAFPDAEGELAGRRGPYAEILAEALDQDGLRVPIADDARWPTFAGAPSRTKDLAEPVDPGALVWSIPLRTPFDASANLNASPPRFGIDFGMPEDDFPAFFPVLQGDEVYLTDGRTVVAYPLEGSPDGSPTPAPAWRASPPSAAPSAALPSFGVERHTLTLFGDRVYARVGPHGSDFRGRNLASAPSTAIAAFDRARSDAPLWIRSADEVMDGPGQAQVGALAGQVAFGGAPVVDEHGVYVALLKPGTQALTWVACLDPDSGRTRWVRFVCSGSPAFSRIDNARRRGGMIVAPELGHRLLTLGGSTIYYQTDLGATASIDARTGRLNWLATYPRRQPPTSGLAAATNHNPAVVYGDTVIVAPEDSDRLFAFDRASGRLAWQAEPGGRVTHLLGVASGKVVATGNHVWTIDVRTGAVRSRWPEGPMLEQGYGRGLLAGGDIYWPTRDMLYILDQATGRPTDRPPIPLREAFGCGGGNLVAGDGYLLIAERDHLRVFCKPSRMLRYYRDRIAETPGRPELHYRLARTAEALGDELEALASLERALELAGPTDRIDGRRLVEAAQAERFKIRMKLAGRLAGRGEPGEAVPLLELAAASAPGPRERLEAELALADARRAAGDPAGAIAVLQEALARPEVRELDLPADEHRTLRAELLVVDRLRALIEHSGPDRYARFDDEAAELLRRGLEADDPRLLAEVVRRFPVSAHVPEALEALGARAEGRGDWSDAARTYHQLLVSAPDDRRRARALLGLARCYEALDLTAEAREAYLQAEARYGPIELELDGSGRTLGRYVAERLASAEEASAGLARAIEPPLGRLDPTRWPAGFAPLELDDPTAVPVGGSGRPAILLGDGRLRGIDPESGAERWEADLGARPSWSGIAGGLLLVATPDRILGLDLETGEGRWEVAAELGEPGFGRPEPRPGARPRPEAVGFRGFRLHGDRLFVLRGDRDLVCLDPVAGRPQWTYRSPSTALDPHLGIGLARVVIQSRMPNAIVVLDARDGRTLGTFPQDDAFGPWRRDPHPVALDRVALVPDASTVVLVDLDSGRTIWEAREHSPLPSSPRPSPADPMVLGDVERLLVLRGELLQRLDPNDGKVLWSTAVGRFRADRRAESLLLAPEAVFVLGSLGQGLGVSAIALDDGRRLWGAPLPGDPNDAWGLGLTPDCVLAYRLGDGSPGSGANAPVVLNLIDRDTGRRVQRLVVEGAGPGRRVRLHPDGISVAGGAGLWRLAGPGADRLGEVGLRPGPAGR